MKKAPVVETDLKGILPHEEKRITPADLRSHRLRRERRTAAQVLSAQLPTHRRNRSSGKGHLFGGALLSMQKCTGPQREMLPRCGPALCAFLYYGISPKKFTYPRLQYLPQLHRCKCSFPFRNRMRDNDPGKHWRISTLQQHTDFQSVLRWQELCSLHLHAVRE